MVILLFVSTAEATRPDPTGPHLLHGPAGIFIRILSSWSCLLVIIINRYPLYRKLFCRNPDMTSLMILVSIHPSAGLPFTIYIFALIGAKNAYRLVILFGR